MVITTILITSIVLTATGNIRNIKVPYYIYCYKSYHTKEKCWILYLHLKQQAKAGKGYRRLFNKKRKTYEDDNKGEINFNFIILKAKGYKYILIQKKSVTTLIVFIAIITILITSIVLIATSDIKNIKVPYYIYCYKSYHTKEKCWILYLYLKQQAKAGKGHYRLFNKKRKIYKDNNKLDKPIGLITHFGMIANNNTNNLLHT